MIDLDTLDIRLQAPPAELLRLMVEAAAHASLLATQVDRPQTEPGFYQHVFHDSRASAEHPATGLVAYACMPATYQAVITKFPDGAHFERYQLEFTSTLTGRSFTATQYRHGSRLEQVFNGVASGFAQRTLVNEAILRLEELPTVDWPSTQRNAGLSA